MTPASDHIPPLILAGLDGPLKLYHYLTFLDLLWTPRHMDFRFFTLTSLPRPGEAVSFLLTCLPERNNSRKNHGATCTTTNANARAEEGIDITGTFFQLEIPTMFFPFGRTRAVGEVKNDNILSRRKMERICFLFWMFSCFWSLDILLGSARWDIKSD